MREEIVIKREWVKTAAIIFLGVMLLLTFFSNTILNRSLPEAAVATVQSGSVSPQVRATGLAEAEEQVGIYLEKSREVESVAVKVGAQVQAGDLLFVLKSGEDSELEAEEAALEDLEIEYERAQINAAAPDHSAERLAVESLQTQLRAAVTERDRLKVSDEELSAATAAIEQAASAEARTAAEADLQALQERRDSYLQADEEVKSLQASLSEAQNALAAATAGDSQDQALKALDVKAVEQDLARQRDKVEKLRAETIDTRVTAPAAGVVRELNITAGETSVIGEPLAVIEAPDRGYTLSATVPREQARRLHIGDSAQADNADLWGPPITATLIAIANDPDAPGVNKKLTFSLKGEDIESGAQLTVLLGEKTRNYDQIVPLAAIRTDAEGTFVLRIESKSTPLGERYKAVRAAVEIEAQDDKNAAISGETAAWDYVITSASKPVEPGQSVRLAE